jgi:hypothetical protein
LLQQQGDFVTAHTLANRAAGLFPNSIGGKLCRNLVKEIEAKSATISTERIWTCFEGAGSGLPQTTENQGAAAQQTCPMIAVQYRNVSTVYFRAVPYDWETFTKGRRSGPENLTGAERRRIASEKPALEWKAVLPDTGDYKENTKIVTAPGTLKPGFYFIVASWNLEFSEKDNLVSFAAVWVTDLSLVTRSRNGQLEGFVLAASSGEPIEGAEISIWHTEQTGNRIADPGLKTDANGAFAFTPSPNLSYLFRARFDGREISAANEVYGNSYQPNAELQPRAETVFFTDRAIYRPGQTIQYKGICLWVDQLKDKYEVLNGETLTVVFRDSNGKDIARQEVRANEYGSFAGSFVAPRDRLMGAMSLQAEGRAQGGTSVRVEEYKRPKFQVTLDAPKTAAKLNENVSLTGHAMTYAGAAVDGAPVRYHVVREARMPWWLGWYGSSRHGSTSQEMAHGTAVTEVDGSFKIEFNAKPDPKIPESDDPTFAYQVNVDVTDNAGETRSAQHSIRVGYTALEATLSASDWQTIAKPVEVTVTTRTLDGEPQVAEGRVLIYDLQAPARPQGSPMPGLPVRPFIRRGLNEPIELGSSDDMSNPVNWPLGKVVGETGFTTDTNGSATVSFKLAVGAYRAVVETQDRFGKKVNGRLPLQVLDFEAEHLAIKVPQMIAAARWDSQPGEQFSALWGTGYEAGRAFIEIEHRHELVQRYWTQPGRTQQQINIAVSEAMRGGFTIHVTQIRDNRAYLDSRRVDVPWSNKDLDIKWEHFVSKLQPDQQETWTAVISRPRAVGGQADSEHQAAEMVATLYDESLDAFAPMNWLPRFNMFREDYSTAQTQFGNVVIGFQYGFGRWTSSYQEVQVLYRAFPAELTASRWGFGFAGGGGFGGGVMAKSLASPSARGLTANAPMMEADALASAVGGRADVAAEIAPGEPPGPTAPRLDQVAARKNLNETAFFFPQLVSDRHGVVRMSFTMPQALTTWHFMAFAHDTSVRSGFLQDHVVSSKDLMVQPNPPRFLREGDTVEFTVKVSNQSETDQTGTVRLTFNDVLTGQPVDKLLDIHAVTSGGSEQGHSNRSNETTFTIPPKQSRGFAWRITIPDGCGFLSYKAVGATAKVSDGEEGAVPVISRRILLTESLPLPIRGPATKKFEFSKLIHSGNSKSLQHQSLTVQMVSNPAWYAVLALPYLMEYPHECSEQIFNRLYANALARTVAGSDPKIHRVFEQWRNTPALDSPLEKNQDLKSVALEETPWFRQAQSESQARKNVGILFDDNRLNYEVARTLEKLSQMQLEDGSWPWFPGGRGNDYITLYVTTGFGRLRHLGADVNVAPALRSLAHLDALMTERYERIQRLPEPAKYVPGPTDALFLYGRSFFLKDQAIAQQHRKAIDFFLNQSRKFWLKTDCRQSQGQLAIALERFSAATGAKDPVPAEIMTSVKERSVTNEEFGMFWRETELSWWWYRAPIETQALMIEAFDEVMHDQAAVENCKVWLLKQKQTQDWKTTKATADAVYALLLRGRDLLSSDALVQVKLDGKDITPAAGQAQNSVTHSRTQIETASRPEAGTGFYEVRFSPAEIKPRLGEITVHKTDQGVAWGSVYWQYLEDISKVTPYEGTPLKLTKTLFTKRTTGRGPVLEPVKGAVHVGDELVVRVELRVDRDMEYVHLKDQRGSGTEPVNVLSQYKYQDGLAYYESTRDTASHFFIDYLPKGSYVFEYSTRVQLRGRYQTGVAEIQCLYAPEFGSHSASVELTVE